MTYLPTEQINEEYFYEISNDVIVIFKNCENDECQCNDVYTNMNYMTSDDYTCYIQDNIFTDSSNFTDNFYYRQDFDKIMILFYLMAFFVIYCPIIIITRFFRRFSVK